MAPIALRVQIADVELVLEAKLDGSSGSRDLPCNEGLTTQGALVIEQNPVRGVKTICLSIIHRNPEGVKLRYAIGAAQVERSSLALWDLLNEAVKFRRRGLIK